MKKKLLILSSFMIFSLTACILEEETDCVETQSCETTEEEFTRDTLDTDTLNVDTLGVDTLGRDTLNTEITDKDNWKQDSIVELDSGVITIGDQICPVFARLPSECGINEVEVDIIRDGCTVGFQCELKESCNEIVEVESLNCSSDQVVKLIEESEGCFQNQCVTANSQCGDPIVIPDSIRVRNTMSLSIFQPQAECVDVFDMDGCFVKEHCIDPFAP